MESPGEGNIFVLPNSKMTFTFTDAYSQEALADLAREIVKNPEAAKKFREDFQCRLAEVGIEVTNVDGGRITDEDVLVALGHRVTEKQPVAVGQSNILGQGPAYVVAVVVVIGAFQGSGNLPED